MDQGTFLLALVVAAVAVVILFKTAIVVPQQSAFVVERLGKYSKTISAGFHILVPGLERIAYKHTLKEAALDIAEQICITKDNVQVGIDGVLYLQVLDPARASYGIADYHFAISQLAQTTLRSQIGKIDLDRTFEERATINANIVSELDKASEPWGVKVLRYEIKSINPPRDVIQAMEKQMRAEGEKQRVIKESEASRQQQINVAAGEAEAILAVATATAEGLRRVAEAVATAGGREAMQLRVAESYVAQFGNLARSTNTLVVPANLSDIASMIAMATKVFDQSRAQGGTTPAAR